VQTYSLDIPVHSLGAEEALFYIAPESVVTLVFVLFHRRGGMGLGIYLCIAASFAKSPTS